MPSEEPRQEPMLRIERDFAHSISKLWQAWIDPDRLLLWFGPEHAPARDIIADVRKGGDWRACLESDETGSRLYVSGRYEEIVPEKRLVFSFRWEGDTHEDGAGVDTLVTVEFIALAAGRSRLVLTQVGLVSQDSADGHARGWSSCLDRLEMSLGRHAPSIVV